MPAFRRARLSPLFALTLAAFAAPLAAQSPVSDVQARCARNPEACDRIRAANEQAQAQCAANPEACEQGKDTAMTAAQSAMEQGEAYCAENPAACDDASAAVQDAKDTCADPAACDELKAEAGNRVRERLNGRQSP